MNRNRQALQRGRAKNFRLKGLETWGNPYKSKQSAHCCLFFENFDDLQLSRPEYRNYIIAATTWQFTSYAG
eukprot:2653672-Ditylum_brightwellii.AAC.1